MGVAPEFTIRGTGDSATAAANTAVVLTYAAVATERHIVEQVTVGYSAAPTAGSLKIEDGSGNVVFLAPVTAAGPTVFSFPRPWAGSLNTALIVTLAAGSGAVVGFVNVSKYGEST